MGIAQELVNKAIKGRKIMLPIHMDGQGYEFQYDSGCSAFGLITNKLRNDDYGDNDVNEVKYNAKSWANHLPIVSQRGNKTMQIGNAVLPLNRVSFVDTDSPFQSLVVPLY